jgi:hypothetical protein
MVLPSMSNEVDAKDMTDTVSCVLSCLGSYVVASVPVIVGYSDPDVIVRESLLTASWSCVISSLPFSSSTFASFSACLCQ